jgi:hypothetical protein
MSDIDPVAAFLDKHTFPNEQGEWQKLENGEITLTHYTSAEAAYKIISSKKIYMRDARFTNDQSEIHYGYDLLIKAFLDKYAALYKDLFNKIDNSLIDKFHEIIQRDIKIVLQNNFIFCLFGQDSTKTDELHNGKLSMWRSYGGKNGVCFQFNGNVASTSLVNPVLSKVNYWNYDDLDKEMERFYNFLMANIDFISQSKSVLIEKIINKIKYDLAFMKNPRFKEENEWRLVCFPEFGVDSEYIVENVIINGIPQVVVSVPFSADYGTSFEEIIGNVVIGPSSYAPLIQRSIAELLRVEGVQKAHDIVLLSDTPANF